jgi:GT2 family glycosyltransferase
MVYIILPVHDRLYKTLEFVDCLIKQTIQDYHLLLIDDGSVDETASTLFEILHEKITIISGKGNWWWGGSLHQGYKWIVNSKAPKSNDYVLIMNNDTTYESNFIEQGISEIDKYDKALLTAYAYNQQTLELIDKGTHVDWDKFQFRSVETENEINCLSTRGLIMKLNTFKKLGGFYPILLPHYLSDYEYTIRAYQNGHKLLSKPNFKLFVDEITTGIDTPDKGDFLKRLKSMFSKRYKANPIYHINFILLISPRKLKNLKLIFIDHVIKAKQFFFNKS